MLLDYKDRRWFCDVCGEEMEDEGDFRIAMTYGSEDDCFGSSGDEYELFTEFDSDTMRPYLSQDEYHFCHECRCGENYMKQFEDEARGTRVQLIRRLIEKKVLPGFEEKAGKRKALEERLEEKLR